MENPNNTKKSETDPAAFFPTAALMVGVAGLVVIAAIFSLLLYWK